MKRRTVIGALAASAMSVGLFPGRVGGQTDLRPALPIPPIARTDAEGTINLRFQEGTMSFLNGKSTPTFGLNGPYLGPTIRVQRGETVTMNVTNGLDQPVTLHWHGLEIPGNQDGGPHQIIQPGKSWSPTLTIDQPAATCWYHPHIYPTTADLVVKGLAGLFIIEDDEVAQLGLPGDWGVDDIPLVIQDRRFRPDGEIDYTLLEVANVATGYVGDTVLVNGAIHPVVTPPSGWVRFRLLNGSNARGYEIAASDGRTLHVIGSDGGLLDAPVEVTSLPIMSGERYEIMVSTSDGKPFDFVTLPVEQMGMNAPPFNQTVALLSVSPTDQIAPGRLPDSLVELPVVDASRATQTRHLVLGMDPRLDAEARPIIMARVKGEPLAKMAMNAVSGSPPPLTADQLKTVNSINGRPFDLQHIEFACKKGEYERWIISEGDDTMTHPVHLHGCQFRLLSLDGKAPPAYARGWKDIVTVSKSSQSEILVQFNHNADASAPYMAHCHILEHEDTGMMTQFTVV